MNDALAGISLFMGSFCVLVLIFWAIVSFVSWIVQRRKSKVVPIKDKTDNLPPKHFNCRCTEKELLSNPYRDEPIDLTTPSPPPRKLKSNVPISDELKRDAVVKVSRGPLRCSSCGSLARPHCRFCYRCGSNDFVFEVLV